MRRAVGVRGVGIHQHDALSRMAGYALPGGRERCGGATVGIDDRAVAFELGALGASPRGAVGALAGVAQVPPHDRVGGAPQRPGVRKCDVRPRFDHHRWIDVALMKRLVDDAFDESARQLVASQPPKRAAGIGGHAGGGAVERILRPLQARHGPGCDAVADGERVFEQHAGFGVGACGLNPGAPALEAGARVTYIGGSGGVPEEVLLNGVPGGVPALRPNARRGGQRVGQARLGEAGQRPWRGENQVEQRLHVERGPGSLEGEWQQLQRPPVRRCDAVPGARLPRERECGVEKVRVATLSDHDHAFIVEGSQELRQGLGCHEGAVRASDDEGSVGRTRGLAGGVEPMLQAGEGGVAFCGRWWRERLDHYARGFERDEQAPCAGREERAVVDQADATEAADTLGGHGAGCASHAIGWTGRQVARGLLRRSQIAEAGHGVLGSRVPAGVDQPVAPA